MAKANTAAVAVAPVALRTIAQAPATNVARAAANAGKYAKAPRAIATATVAYALTSVGTACAAANGAGKSGKVTVMGLVALAAQHAMARNGGKPVTGLQIVTAMRALPAVKAAYANTKAGGGYANGTPCPAWCSGYVAGAARASHGLLAAVKA